MHKSVLDDLVAAALHAAKFGSLARLLISEDSKASEAAAPEFYSGLVAKLSSLSDVSIEWLAVPLVGEHLSQRAATRALEFFSSPTGAGIAAKLSALGALELSSTETDALAQFSASEAGAEFLAAMGDPMIIATIVQEIGDHAP